MKKATQKSQPATAPTPAAAPASAAAKLGTKRSCPQCGTKFYDFTKPQFNCPKCQTSFDAEQFDQLQKAPVEVKKTKEKEKASGDDPLTQADEMVSEEAETYESVDDLNDEDEDIVEEIDVDEEEQES